MGAKSRKYREARARVLANAERCTWCGVVISDLLPVGHPQKATADHVRARVDGGIDAVDNLVPACWRCNSRRGRRDPSCLRTTLVEPGDW